MSVSEFFGNAVEGASGHPFLSPFFGVKNVFEGLGDRFRFENAQLDSNDLLVAVAVVAVGAVTMWSMASYLRRSERPKNIDNPKKLFQELCAVHRLERHEALLLRSVAEAIPIENPSMLFIDPGLLDAAILDVRWSEESAELSRFRELIFSDDDQSAAA